VNGAPGRAFGGGVGGDGGVRLHPADALAVIQYLDVLRDGLWSEYGDEIAAAFGADPDGHDDEELDERQIDLAFEDSIPF